MRYVRQYRCLLCVVAAGFFYLAASASAQENYYNTSLQEGAAVKNPEASAKTNDAPKPAAAGDPPAARLLTVTSIEKCYAQLSREDALDIQRNYLKPYQECQRRLALKLKDEQTVKAGGVKEEAPEKSGGFFSVSPKRAGVKKEEKEAEAGKAPFLQDKVPLK